MTPNWWLQRTVTGVLRPPAPAAEPTALGVLMTVRASIHRSVDPAEALNRIPKQLRGAISVPLLGTEPIDLIVFEPGGDQVVTSKNLRRTLAKHGPMNRKLVVVGQEFTEEAYALATADGGLVFPQRSVFCWTDQRWDEVRERFGR
jgi:hypothetical protein